MLPAKTDRRRRRAGAGSVPVTAERGCPNDHAPAFQVGNLGQGTMGKSAIHRRFLPMVSPMVYGRYLPAPTIGLTPRAPVKALSLEGLGMVGLGRFSGGNPRQRLQPGVSSQPNNPRPESQALENYFSRANYLPEKCLTLPEASARLYSRGRDTRTSREHGIVLGLPCSSHKGDRGIVPTPRSETGDHKRGVDNWLKESTAAHRILA